MPLISLIFDQEMQAKKMGIEAYSMTANTSQSEYKFIYQKLNSFREI
jgi:superfamily II DNA helicase RecQ